MENVLTKKFEELLATLREEVSKQKELLTIAHAKRTALVRMDIKRVDETNKLEESAVISLGKVAEKRINLLSSIADILMLTNQGEHILTDIIKRIGEPFAGQLNFAVAELRKIAHEVVKINRHNKALLEQSLTLVREFLGIIGGEQERDLAYTKAGMGKKIGIPGRLMVDHVA